ncbi:Sodium/calcium exchanger membrane region [Penicillium cosmopolitanum]|uniref:Vacuolar calcium ion transporter n=1 Tax=Penicillium cosmopolitanum TaxID=1131564 RepID=A0A9W9W0N2_9EURO|nr:Sodium/calcium exchanger membrane region [Penicillium cosmopolitanum]KAJ5396500.1 Sodium/calcium exchanger membrane region [Penicillium cosmopolitanum]
MATGDALNPLLELVQLPMQAGNDTNRLRPIMLLLPIAGLARLFHWSAAIVLVVNLVAIIFLSDVISSASDELADSLGHLQGALIGATLGNTVELTSGVLALLHGDIVFAQSVMIFGFCIVTASYNKHVLEFNGHLAKTLSSLMMITAVTMLLPTALYSTFPVSQIDKSVLAFSRGTSFVLFLLYGGYLYFHMKSHKHLFLSEEEEEQEETHLNEVGGSKSTKTPSEQSDTSKIVAPSMRLAAAVAATIFCTELIFEGIDDMVDTFGFSRMFIAVILIPIASNSTEGTTVIASARSGDTDSAIRVIVDSLLQIGLFVIPLLVIIGWCIGEPMSLYFDPFQSGMMFLAVLVVNHLLRDGQYAYIHGAMLVALYGSLIVAFYAR